MAAARDAKETASSSPCHPDSFEEPSLLCLDYQQEEKEAPHPAPIGPRIRHQVKKRGQKEISAQLATRALDQGLRKECKSYCSSHA